METTIEFKSFDASDWELCSGAEGTDPKICYTKINYEGRQCDTVIVCDDCGLTVMVDDCDVDSVMCFNLYAEYVYGDTLKALRYAKKINWKRPYTKSLFRSMGFFGVGA